MKKYNLSFLLFLLTLSFISQIYSSDTPPTSPTSPHNGSSGLEQLPRIVFVNPISTKPNEYSTVIQRLIEQMNTARQENNPVGAKELEDIIVVATLIKKKVDEYLNRLLSGKIPEALPKIQRRIKRLLLKDKIEERMPDTSELPKITNVNDTAIDLLQWRNIDIITKNEDLEILFDQFLANKDLNHFKILTALDNEVVFNQRELNILNKYLLLFYNLAILKLYSNTIDINDKKLLPEMERNRNMLQNDYIDNEAIKRLIIRANDDKTVIRLNIKKHPAISKNYNITNLQNLTNNLNNLNVRFLNI